MNIRILLVLFVFVIVGCQNPNRVSTRPFINYSPSRYFPGWYEFSCSDRWIRNQWWSKLTMGSKTIAIRGIPTEIDAIKACHKRGLKPIDILNQRLAEDDLKMKKWMKENL